MKVINACKTRFFLTGGTALSRVYFNHRYSDDLDFFINEDDDYPQQLNVILVKLKENGFFWDGNFLKTERYCSLKLQSKEPDTNLKLDFVNDISSHFGDIIKTNLFDRVDSVRNILSNKITALFRLEAKDIVDIREIALHTDFDWFDIINEAREKENGLEIPVIVQIIKGMPKENFEAVNWINQPDWDTFMKDIDIIMTDLINGRINSLTRK